MRRTASSQLLISHIYPIQDGFVFDDLGGKCQMIDQIVVPLIRQVQLDRTLGLFKAVKSAFPFFHAFDDV